MGLRDSHILLLMGWGIFPMVVHPLRMLYGRSGINDRLCATENQRVAVPFSR